MLNEYVITVKSKYSKDLNYREILAHGKVVAVADTSPDTVSVAWLSERYPAFSKQTIRAKLEPIKQGSTGKAFYDREAACELLSSSIKTKRGPKRKY